MGMSPAELLCGRWLRSHLDLLHPDLNSEVLSKQENQWTNQNKGTKDKVVSIGDTVYVLDLLSKSSWIPGTIKEERGGRTYLVELSGECVVHRHVDHICHRTVSVTEPQLDIGDFPLDQVEQAPDVTEQNVLELFLETSLSSKDPNTREGVDVHQELLAPQTVLHLAFNPPIQWKRCGILGTI